jgi:hypothetical protein
VASLTHFLVKLVLAAPDSFLSAACVSQARRSVGLAFLHEAGECGAGEFLLCGPVVAGRIGDGTADCEARKHDRESETSARELGWIV